jgi:hypothetical protein
VLTAACDFGLTHARPGRRARAGSLNSGSLTMGYGGVIRSSNSGIGSGRGDGRGKGWFSRLMLSGSGGVSGAGELPRTRSLEDLGVEDPSPTAAAGTAKSAGTSAAMTGSSSSSAAAAAAVNSVGAAETGTLMEDSELECHDIRRYRCVEHPR